MQIFIFPSQLPFSFSFLSQRGIPTALLVKIGQYKKRQTERNRRDTKNNFSGIGVDARTETM